MEKKIYHCSSDIKSPIFVDGLDGLPILKGYYQAYVYHIPICIKGVLVVKVGENKSIVWSPTCSFIF